MRSEANGRRRIVDDDAAGESAADSPSPDDAPAGSEVGHDR
jgi:hypothetical protein